MICTRKLTGSCQFNLAQKLKKNNNVLNGTKKVKIKNQDTDGYGRDKRPEIEKLKRKEIIITETRKKVKQKKIVKQSGYP